jgi:GNAT superfamily N-acetyltransferase
MTGWRAMRIGDVAAVSAISDAVHGRYTERPEVYAERLRLYPAGCHLLERDGKPVGYLVSHPWRGDRPPPLDAMMGALPVDADHYYLHDLALLPEARGLGAAGAAIELVVAQARAEGFAAIGLTAVNGAEAFWRRQGFTAMEAKSGGYGTASVAMMRSL